MSFPSGYLVEKVGYRKGIVTGLTVAGIGCAAFYPAATEHSYVLFLAALFVLASGITLLQVAANPYVAILGEPQTAASRLNLTQAFNSAGTTVGPWLGSVLILSVASAGGAEATQTPYLILAGTLFVIAIVFSRLNLPVISPEQPLKDESEVIVRKHSVWQYRHLVLGAAAIFVYVGAEVTIGSFLVNFMALDNVASLPESTAGQYLSLYWGGAMVGRFIGAAVLRRVKAGHLLAFNAACVVVLLLVGMTVEGPVAMYAVLAIGLFNSIMFPTIFTLGIANLGKHTGEGSGVLCMAIVGGAIVPIIAGYVADLSGIAMSFSVSVVCYVYIVYYGLNGHRDNTVNRGD
jgi:FHS family L-fucose permease-like MFS transporter